MDRIRPLSRQEAHPDVQPFYDQDMKAFGLVLNPTGVLAYRPPIMTAMRGLNRSIFKEPTLAAGLKSLVCVRIAALVGCPF
ncbi:MAG TPA: hypothetical protein VKV26_06775 [Dehalococcoidia bacterium]|nr:hypothetical protein [Dehalococcoidia bacterium]